MFVFPQSQAKLFFTAVLIVVLCLGFTFLAVSPLAARGKKLNEQILKDRRLLENITLEIVEHQKLAEDLARVESGRKQIANMFPAREEAVALVQGLELAAQRSGLTSGLILTDLEENSVQGQEPPAAAVPDGLKQIEQVPFRVSLEGDYRQFTDYLIYLEHLPFVLETDEFSISAQSSQESEGGPLQNTGKGTAEIKGFLYIKSNTTEQSVPAANSEGEGA